MNSKEKKQAWPTKKAMLQVYKEHLWGGHDIAFYSGEGSHLPAIVEPFLKAVISFLTSFKIPISVCDLGCGDFNIGKSLVEYTKQYEAVDIVPDLIAHNKKHYQSPNLNFHCLDIAMEALPEAECVILRQVLQHLSNTEVINIAKKLSDFKYVILTEHVPNGVFEPNLDIISGQGIRLKKQSGIDLLAAPINMKVRNEKVLHTYTLSKGKGVIITKLYTL